MSPSFQSRGAAALPHDEAPALAGEAIARRPATGRRTGGVISLDALRFEQECAWLMQLAGREERPDALVAIRSGGVYVAEAMARSVEPPVPILAITCRRPSTATKQRAWVVAVLGHLPRGVLDRLRVLEHWFLTRRPLGRNTASYEFDAAELEALDNWIGQAGSHLSLLVVDDAVDSGATLSLVLAKLNERIPQGARLRSAVITVTTEKPIATADYALYYGQLFRFPWSQDA